MFPVFYLVFLIILTMVYSYFFLCFPSSLSSKISVPFNYFTV